jgi:hypothetical protein
MRFYNHQHQYYCGIDLHVKTMYVCILDATGQVLVHRNVVQEFASYARLVKCQKQSGGRTLGTRTQGGLRGAKMGNVHWKLAFSEAAVVSQTSNSSHGTTLAEIAQHACAAERHEPSIRSHRSGNERAWATSIVMRRPV